MKEYIIIKIIDNSLVFDFKSIDNSEREYVNTNIFYKDTLYYTLKYYKKNKNKILVLFDKYKNNIDWFIIKRIITFKYAIVLMKYIEINNLRLLFNSTLSLNDYNEILNADIKTMDCYYMPSFVKEKYNKKGIEVITHNDYKISDTFMLDQDALDYEVLYYKKDIYIRSNYNTLLDDLKEFLRINYNIKIIHLYVFDKTIIENINKLLEDDESKNVIVFLHQSADENNFINNNFTWLKNMNKECKDNLICDYRIIYSNKFIRNNLFKQLSLNNVKLLFILAIYVSGVSLLMFESYKYVEKLNIDKLKTEIMNNELNVDYTEELNSIDVELTSEEEAQIEEKKSKYELQNIMSSLKKINNETIGYLVVRNTNISYPVVQHSDNSYYLKRDFYKSRTSMGWIYRDYRNSKDKLDLNNIIYGHSMKNGTMFGTLKKTLSSSWRKDSENMIIKYDTEYGSYKFKIFSVYKVDYTTDYLKVNFDSEKDYNDFINLIRKRSVFKSNDKIEYPDIILTLSTCTGSSNQRLVVHAVMIGD